MSGLPVYVTKRGDEGFTDFGGKRIAKSEYSVRLVGRLDSFQAFLGKLEFHTRRSFIDRLFFRSDGINEMIKQIIIDIYLFMSAPHMKNLKTCEPIEGLDNFLIENNNKKIKYFQLPIYQNEKSVLLNEARTLTRNLESFVSKRPTLLRVDDASSGVNACELMRYLNRLSDVFYCMINMIEDEPIFVHIKN